MIKSKPAALPSCCVSTHNLIAIIAHTVEVAVPATPPVVSSGKSATLRLPLSIINGDALKFGRTFWSNFVNFHYFSDGFVKIMLSTKVDIFLNRRLSGCLIRAVAMMKQARRNHHQDAIQLLASPMLVFSFFVPC